MTAAAGHGPTKSNLFAEESVRSQDFLPKLLCLCQGRRNIHILHSDFLLAELLECWFSTVLSLPMDPFEIVQNSTRIHCPPYCRKLVLTVS